MATRDYFLGGLLPAPDVPVVDIKTGLMTEPWRLREEAVHTVLFGADGTTDITLNIVVGPLVNDVIGDEVKGLTAAGNPAPGFTVTLTLDQSIKTTASPTFAGLTINGNIAVTGTVDGRDVSVDGAKLNGIETGATADQTGAEIKIAYEGELNTNAYTDAEKTKLTGIATAATANATDAQLRDRTTHTGLQAIATVTGLQAALDGKVTKDAVITAASETHTLNATFSNTEVEAALNALGAIINEMRASFNA